MRKGQMVRVKCEGVSVFLLLVFAALHHTVKADLRKLDMALDAVDDIFSQCQDKMLKAVTEIDGLLQKELKDDKEFEELWRKYSGTCKKNITGGTSYHIDALEAYGNSKPKFRKMFNNLVYSKGNNTLTYRDEFPFKSLHFLLTDSVRLLKPTNKCETKYYATRNTYTADTGTEVRFGKFINAKNTLSSTIEELEPKEDGVTMFNITSCSVINVEENTCTSEEIQCLISPAEVFTVEDVRDATTDDDTTYKLITLTHSRFLSNHNCAFFHRNSADVESSTSLIFTLLALTASLLTQFTVME
ncbi:ecto-ADP-ribosyltransferase 5-like [Neoarius graeffei]|uniref:ecto-ADP-ribosyltransferase 5-like n=1 Tax=Neoarius graeffei TaxID=443677 RepID=UPI00298D0283|nr:ecto-ADP-ribosyltransferase 5-like [Neoarius graeffei]